MPFVHADLHDGPFGKRVDCPPSEELLACAGAHAPEPLSLHITSHLAGCDFCGAELSLLRKHYPPDEVPPDTPPLPLSLLLLAQRALPSGVEKRLPQTGKPANSARAGQIPMTPAAGAASHAMPRGT